MKSKAIKIVNCIFIVFFMLILIIPVIFMNFKENQVSEIDNKLLTEFPDFSESAIDSDTVAQLESYFDDRAGLRNAAIRFYTTACDRLFGVLVHPLYMYGQDGHVYYRENEYITAYQRLNTDERFIDGFVDFLKKTDSYCKEKNIKFLYYLCTDKKTIYPEFFPQSINVKADNESVIECMDRKLKGTDIDYIIPYDALMEQKNSELIYNKKYDVAHWNELGSFTAHSLLDNKLQSWFDDIPPLSKDLFDIEYVKQDKLYQSELKIDEDIPVFSLKQDLSEEATEYLSPYLEMTTTDFYKHYINPNVNNDHVLIIFTDSYFATYSKYYNNRFKEVYYIHRQNFQNLQYYVNLLFPDIIIFETAERCITSDMTLTDIYGSYENYNYEKPYDRTKQYTYVNQSGIEMSDDMGAAGSLDMPDNQGVAASEALKIPDLSYSIYSVKGARIDGKTIKINPDGGDSIVSINGIMKNYEDTKDLDIYFVIDDHYLETGYNALNVMNPYAKTFSINVQRRYIGQTEIRIIGVDTDTNTEYEIDKFEVIYG